MARPVTSPLRDDPSADRMARLEAEVIELRALVERLARAVPGAEVPDLIGVKDAARRTGLHVSTVRRLAKAPGCGSYVGRKLFVSFAALQRAAEKAR